MMTDDLYDRFRRAADPGGRRLHTTPAELLVRARRDRRRHRIVASGGGTAVAAVTAGVLAFGFTSLGGSGSDDDSDPPVASPSPRTDGETVPLDLGPLSEQQAQKTLERCARGYGGAERFTLVTARRVAATSGPEAALVARDPDTGDVFRCWDDGESSGLSGPTAGDGPEPPPDAQDPFRDTEFDDDGAYCSRDRETGTREYMFQSDWLRVADEVDRVDIRVGTDEEPGVWRVSRAHAGYAYTAFWFKQPFPPDATIEVEMRAFDAAGDPLPDGASESGTVVESYRSKVKPNGHWSLC